MLEESKRWSLNHFYSCVCTGFQCLHSFSAAWHKYHLYMINSQLVKFWYYIVKFVLFWQTVSLFKHICLFNIYTRKFWIHFKLKMDTSWHLAASCGLSHIEASWFHSFGTFRIQVTQTKTPEFILVSSLSFTLDSSLINHKMRSRRW